jgi:hypothetical protein
MKEFDQFGLISIFNSLDVMENSGASGLFLSFFYRLEFPVLSFQNDLRCIGCIIASSI